MSSFLCPCPFPERNGDNLLTRQVGCPTSQKLLRFLDIFHGHYTSNICFFAQVQQLCGAGCVICKKYFAHYDNGILTGFSKTERGISRNVQHFIRRKYTLKGKNQITVS